MPRAHARRQRDRPANGHRVAAACQRIQGPAAGHGGLPEPGGSPTSISSSSTATARSSSCPQKRSSCATSSRRAVSACSSGGRSSGRWQRETQRARRSADVKGRPEDADWRGGLSQAAGLQGREAECSGLQDGPSAASPAALPPPCRAAPTDPRQQPPAPARPAAASNPEGLTPACEGVELAVAWAMRHRLAESTRSQDNA